jgi:hypothetical protein
MKIELREPYQPRPLRFLELWQVDDWRLKVIGIAYGRATPDVRLVDAAKRTAAEYLRTHPTRHAHYGVGFLGVHDGRGENQVFLDRWINENELMHAYWVSPKHDPERLLVPDVTDHNSVCVWDLAVQCFEREAWLECVLANPRGPDLDAYLTRRIRADA